MARVLLLKNRQRGFARLGAQSDRAAAFLKPRLEQRDYESEVARGEIWVRYKPRRTCFPGQYARILATSSASSTHVSDFEWISTVDQRYDQLYPSARIAECHEVVQRAVQEPDFRFLYRLNLALCVCPRSSRRAFLIRNFLPAFLQRFPTGRIVFIGTDSRLESQIPILRVGNYIQVNGLDAIQDLESNPHVAVGTATELHQTAVVALHESLRAMLGNFLPLRTHFVGGRPGLIAVYFFGHSDRPVIDMGSFPRTEAEIHGTQNFMRGDEPDLPNSRDPAQAWLGRFRNTEYPGDEQATGLLATLIDKFNQHIANRLEVCNFTDHETVDFVEAFEKYLTIDRIFHECLMVATTTNSAIARLVTFAVLDKFQELCRFPGIESGRNFHHMCTRLFLTTVLLPSFDQLPSPWNDYFRAKAVDLYDDLYSTIRSPRGVWPNHLVQSGGGIRVYRVWDGRSAQFVNSTVTQNDDAFVGEYVRAARNTHHGYISDGDNRRRFATYGSISTAFLPDSFTQLPLLILLAEILSPRSLSGYHWLDQTSLELTV